MDDDEHPKIIQTEVVWSQTYISVQHILCDKSFESCV